MGRDRDSYHNATDEGAWQEGIHKKDEGGEGHATVVYHIQHHGNDEVVVVRRHPLEEDTN